jgi:hypothetical protein
MGAITEGDILIAMPLDTDKVKAELKISTNFVMDQRAIIESASEQTQELRPPAGYREVTGADGKPLYIKNNATVKAFKGTPEEKNTLRSGVKVNNTKGWVYSFTDDTGTYLAAYNNRTGEFVEYRNSKSQATYINPAGLRTIGTYARIGFGETRGLFPSKDGEKVSSRPRDWDYESSIELMAARAAIEVVAQRNSRTHPGATPSSNPENAEYYQKQFAISENFPKVDPVIADDPQVTHFYIAPSPDFIPGNRFVDKRYWNISIAKSYGPFYNASSMGDTKQGGKYYVIFYKVAPK